MSTQSTIDQLIQTINDAVTAGSVTNVMVATVMDYLNRRQKENASSMQLLSDKTYIHEQNVAAATWQITHNLGKYPSVTVVDSSGRLFFGDVQYVDANNLSITFHGSFSGKAILN